VPSIPLITVSLLSEIAVTLTTSLPIFSKSFIETPSGSSTNSDVEEDANPA
jgi:hypothetical protein